MSDENRLMRNIEKLGGRYCKEILLKGWKKERLESDWWEGLKFFFGHSFMRGRRDELSNEYCCFTVEVLKEYLSISSESVDKSYEKLKASKELFDKDLILAFKNAIRITGTKGGIIKHPNFDKEVASKHPLVKILSTPKTVAIKWEERTYHKAVHLGNEEDIMMVLDVLKLISDKNKKNIYKHLKETIHDKGVKEAYNELIKIRAISDKIATFVIRDIGLLNPEIIKAEDCEYAFPVDVWVNRISTRLGIEGDDVQDVKQIFIKACIGCNISPLKFAAGLWYLGFNSLDLALEYLDEVEIDIKR